MSSFNFHRPRLLGIAYRMLGTISDAEDMVQEAYLRWHKTEQESINNTEAFLVTITTRLCLDFLKSAKVQRETYIGPWLPEPLVSSAQTQPCETHDLADTLSFAFLLLLERLSPTERAAYILREAFDLTHSDIASVLDLSPSNSRQITKRAKQRLQEDTQRFEASNSQHQKIFMEFVTACGTGNMEQLNHLLAEDVKAYSDGGGKVIAALRPLHGKDRVLRFLSRLLKNSSTSMTIEFCTVNNAAGIKLIEDGNIKNIITMQIINGKVKQFFSVRNPDKLTRTERTEHIR